MVWTQEGCVAMGKRFTRYWSDPQFRAAVDREFDFADREAREGGWITYAIHDPTRPDPSGRYDSLIIYVGQSKEFAKRVRKRMRDAGTAVRRPLQQIDGALYDVMARGGVPRFRVLERVGDAIASFVSETNWAKRLTAEGYPLLNKWTEQKFGGLAISRSTVPHQWLWRLAVEDAIEAGLDVIVVNKDTGQDLVLNLTDIPPKTFLRDVKAGALEQLRSLGYSGSVRLYVR